MPVVAPDGDPDAVVVIDEAPGDDEAGRLEAAVGDHEPRPEREDLRAAVGLEGDRRADPVALRADPDLVADRKPEPLEERGVRGGTPFAALERECAAKRSAALDRDRAIERIGRVHRLELDEHRRIARRVPRHRPHFAGERKVARLSQRLQHRRLGRAINAPELEIAAEDGARVDGDALGHHRRDRADRGDDGDAEREA